MEEKKYVGPSLDPDDAISGGLFDDRTCTWENAAFVMYNYNDTQKNTPALQIDLVVPGEDVHTQYYSVGSPEFWAPSPDGKWIVPVGSEQQIRKGSNLNILMKSMKEAGYPMSLLAKRDISVVNGLVAHMRRKAVAGREDMRQQSGAQSQKRRGADGKEYEKDNKVLLVERIVSLPGEAATDNQQASPPEEGPKTAGKGKKSGAGKAATNTPSPTDVSSVEDKVRGLVMDLIMQGGGSVDKKSLPTAAYSKYPTDPDRNKILALLVKPGALQELGGFVVGDDGMVVIG